jgi:hypothetical protein
MDEVERTTVVVFQDRTWFGNPQMGAFRVFLDGRAMGVAPVLGQVELPVSPGRHVVRIGQMWFRSPAVVLDVAPGSTTRLRANIPIDLPLLPRLARFLVSPSHCLVLGETQTVAEPARVQRSLTPGRTDGEERAPCSRTDSDHRAGDAARRTQGRCGFGGCRRGRLCRGDGLRCSRNDPGQADRCVRL